MSSKIYVVVAEDAQFNVDPDSGAFTLVGRCRKMFETDTLDNDEGLLITALDQVIEMTKRSGFAPGRCMG